MDPAHGLSAPHLLAPLAAAAALACGGSPGPALLTSNVVDPAAVNAVSKFHSCCGHPYPQPGSPNSGKNYFWGNSTDFGTDGVVAEYAACTGTLSQQRDDLDANELVRGATLHLACDQSSTSLRYFHLLFDPALPGKHVQSGDPIGFASMKDPAGPSASWQNSPSFDVAVSDGDDSNTVDYFARLSPAAFAAWAARGITSVDQTINPGDPSCPAYSCTVGNPDIVSLVPAR